MFLYPPINLDGPAARLLRLIRGQYMDAIECELFEASIDQSNNGIPYSALSYTWGSTQDLAAITVNGSIVDVTMNLYIALQHLRQEDEDRILWIDAICIDQKNLLERSHQVQHMGSIYKEAEQVVIWLGYGTKETDLVMDSMKRLQESNLRVEGNWRRSAQLWMHPQAGLGGINVHQDGLHEGMQMLLARSWFRRIWILQEIANARVATVLCGKKSISARIFAQVPSLIGLQPDPRCQAVLDIMPGFSRQESWWAQSRSLYTLLVKFRDSEATDERDIIYALLGISSDAHNCDILLPEYDKSVQQVIQSTTSFLLSPTIHDHSIYGFLNWTLQEFLENLDSLPGAVLGEASETGRTELVRLLLAMTNIEADSKDIHGKIPLHRAVQHGQVAVVRILLEQSARINSRDDIGRTPLSWAALIGDEDIVNLLLEHGADINTKDNYHRTPLLLAVDNGHKAMVDLLLGKGAKVESKNIDPGETIRMNDNRDEPFDIQAEIDKYRLNGHDAANATDPPTGSRMEPRNDFLLKVNRPSLSQPENIAFSQYMPSLTSVGGWTRALVAHQGKLALLESREYAETYTKAVSDQLRKFLNNLSTFLSSEKDEGTRLLQSGGPYEKNDETYHTFGIIYLFPAFADHTSTPVSLLHLIERRSRRPALGQRFLIARRLSIAVLRLHTSSFLHRGIRPENILFFTSKTDSEGGTKKPVLERPFLSGFEPLNSLDYSAEVLGPESFDPYLHPQQREQGYAFFRREYDIFAFGNLLFELASWWRISDLLTSSSAMLDLGNRPEWEGIIRGECENLRADVGDIYVSAILWCLGLAPGSPILTPAPLTSPGVPGPEHRGQETTLTMEFWENVVRPLESLLV
jgi:serine/threonine protein kinase